MPYPSHGVLGTASPPSLEQTLGGLDNTHAWQRVPRTQVRLPKSHSKIGMLL